MIARRYNPPPVHEERPAVVVAERSPMPMAERDQTIRLMAHQGIPRKKLAEQFGIGRARVSQICRGIHA